jgi:hypothetical protein
MKTSTQTQLFSAGRAVLVVLLFSSLCVVCHAQGPDATAAVESTTTSEAPAAAPEEAAATQEDSPAITFMTKCMGCHTIGGGATSGPDLKNTANYPHDTLHDAVKRMEKNVGPMAEEEVQALTDFLLDTNAAGRLQTQRELASHREAATLEPASAEKGHALFMGATPLANGALACAACHQAGNRGGNLAASLEDAITRLGPDSVMATTETPGFPVMRAIYTPKPVTKQEAVHIVKFLEEVSAKPAPPRDYPLAYAGLAGTVITMLLLGRVTHRRAAGTRARMVAEANRRGNRRIHGRREQ